MSKLKKLILTGLSLLLLITFNACQTKPEGEVIIKNEPIPEIPITQTSVIESSYLPEGWIRENNLFYSPKMYPLKDTGAYSLLLVPNTNFKYVENFLTANSNCIVAKRSITLNNKKSTSYIDKCMIDSPRVTLLEKDNIIIKGVSYSKTDESKEVNKILEGI